MLLKCQGYFIFKWEASIFIKVLKEKELAFATSAFIITDLLEAVYAKKSDVICFCFPPRCEKHLWEECCDYCGDGWLCLHKYYQCTL